MEREMGCYEKSRTNINELVIKFKCVSFVFMYNVCHLHSTPMPEKKKTRKIAIPQIPIISS